MTQNTSSLLALRADLDAAVRRRDASAIAQRLEGRHLPALGGDLEPAEMIYEALMLPSPRPRLPADVSRLLATLCEAARSAMLRERGLALASGSTMAGSVVEPFRYCEDNSYYLSNLFLLAALLPRDELLFSQLREFHESGLRPSVLASGDRVAEQLRRALIEQQTDDRLEAFWFELLKPPHDAAPVGDPLEAWRALLWIPPRPEEATAGNTFNTERVVKALTALHGAVEHGTELVPILRYAVAELAECYPRSPEFFAREFRPFLSDLPEAVTAALYEKWPFLAVGVQGALVDLPEAAEQVWNALSEARRVEVRSCAEKGDFGEWHGLWERLRFGPPDLSLSPQQIHGSLAAVKHAFEHSFPGLAAPRQSTTDDGVAEGQVGDRPGRPADRRLNGLASFERVGKVQAQVEQLLAGGDLLRARKYVEELIEVQEREGTRAELIAKTLSKIAAAALRLNRAEFADDLYRWARTFAPADPVVENGLAEVLKAQGKLVEAEGQYRQTAARFPEAVVTQNGLAEVLKAQGKLEEAGELYRQTAARFPEHVRAQTGLAEVLKAQGKLEEAGEFYRQTAARFPENAVVQTGLAEVLKAQGTLVEAEALYRQTAARFPEDVVVQSGLAEVLKAQGNLEEAGELYRLTAARFPDNVVVQCGLAEVLKAQGKLEEAGELYRLTAARFPEAVVTQTGLAEVLKAQGKLGDSERLYRLALLSSGHNRVVTHGLANLLRARRQYSEALEFLPNHETIRSVQDGIDLHLRGMILLDAGDTAEAVSTFRRGLAGSLDRKQRTYFQTALAVAQLRQQQFEAALSLLGEAPEGDLGAAVLRLHAEAGRGEEGRARVVATALSGKLIVFDTARRAIRHIEQAYGLDSPKGLRRPGLAELDVVFRAEIDMLLAA